MAASWARKMLMGAYTFESLDDWSYGIIGCIWSWHTSDLSLPLLKYIFMYFRACKLSFSMHTVHQYVGYTPRFVDTNTDWCVLFIAFSRRWGYPTIIWTQHRRITIHWASVHGASQRRGVWRYGPRRRNHSWYTLIRMADQQFTKPSTRYTTNETGSIFTPECSSTSRSSKIAWSWSIVSQGCLD